jgi:hypothetical protein
MKPRALAFLVVGGVLGVTAMACSSASPTGTGTDNNTGRKHGSSGSSGSSSATDPGSSDTPTTPSDPTPPTSTPDASTPDSGNHDAGPPPPPKLVCTTIPTCTNVHALKSISGDGSEQTSFTGAGSMWLSIHIREDSLATQSIGFSAELYSPAGGTYEMYVHGSDCTSDLGTSTQLSDGAEGVASWDDTGFLDDAKDVMIEIRHVDGACSATDTWTLDILGGVF